jgi:hypothetical protein
MFGAAGTMLPTKGTVTCAAGTRVHCAAVVSFAVRGLS